MANPKELSPREPRRRVVDSTLGENGLRLVGSKLVATEQPPEPREKSEIDPDEQLVRRVNRQLQTGRRVSANMFLAAVSVGERRREDGVNRDALESFVEDQRRGERGGSEPTQIKGLTFAPPQDQFPIAADSFDEESCP